MSNSNAETPAAPFPWKRELLRALIAAGVGSGLTAVLNAVYKIRFTELDAFIRALPVPLLLLSTGIFVVLSFVFRMVRLEKRIMRLLTDCMLVLGLACLSITVVTALNLGTVPLGNFELNPDNVYAPMEVSIPRNLDSISLKVSGNRNPGFSLELRRYPAGDEDIKPLVIDGLTVDSAIRPGQFYFLVPGEFIVPGPFRPGDTVRITIVNASSFEGRLKLELSGSTRS